MGHKYTNWVAKSDVSPLNYEELLDLVRQNRGFESVESLQYGDYGLEAAYNAILTALKANKKIALYADYDVDGTMSCVSWIWFLESIGYKTMFTIFPADLKKATV